MKIKRKTIIKFFWGFLTFATILGMLAWTAGPATGN